jgi:GNAT superfamily N-acetyltransferase
LTTGYEITPYVRRHRRATLQLVTESFQVHSHLDWQSVEDWLDDSNAIVLLAWQKSHLVGVMAASDILGDATWLRLVAVEDLADPSVVLAALWPPMRQQLIFAGTREVGVLVMRDWLISYLGSLGFMYGEDIITLRRVSADMPPPFREDVRIRNAYWNDLSTVVQVDHAAFAPLWRMGRGSLRQAARVSALFTVAELGGSIVGYQLSTQHADGGHLARLAVLPDVQGQGVGGALVGHLLRNFIRRGVVNVSVNTQQTNEQSQRLYFRFGFQRTMQDLPFWRITL